MAKSKKIKYTVTGWTKEGYESKNKKKIYFEQPDYI